MNRLICILIQIMIFLKVFVCEKTYSADLDNNGIEDHYEQTLANKFCPCL